MSLTRNSTEYDVSNNHGTSTDEFGSTLANSTTFHSTLLSLWSSLSTTLEETKIPTKTPLLEYNASSTVSAGLKLTLLLSKPKSSKPSKVPRKSVTSSTLPVSKLPRWRRRTTLSNTTTTTHVTTTQSHMTTQSLSTVRRTTLTTTTTRVPPPEDSSVSPSAGLPKTVTSIRVTENVSNVTYVSRDVIGGAKLRGNSTTTPQNTQTSSENPNKPSGYTQSIITPLVTPLVPLPVNGGEKHSDKHPDKHFEDKQVSNNRVGPVHPIDNPISYWKPRGHSDVHINEALLNNTATNMKDALPSHLNKGDPQMSDAPAPPDDINRILIPNTDNDIPVAEPLIHRPLNINLLVSSSSSVAFSTSSSSSPTEVTSSSAASASSSASSTVSEPSSSIPSSTFATSSLPSSVIPKRPIIVQPTSISTNPTTLQTSTSQPAPSTNQPSSTLSSSTLSSSTTPSPSQTSITSQVPSSTSTPSSTLSSSSSKLPIYTELWLEFTNRPVSSTTRTTTQATLNKVTFPETKSVTTESTKQHSSAPSQTSKSSLESTPTTLLTTHEYSVAQNQHSEMTKSSEGRTAKPGGLVNFTEPPFGDFLGPRPSDDPPKEEHVRSVDMRNETVPKGSPDAPLVPTPSPTTPTLSSNPPMGVAKPTVYSNTTPVNLTLDKMVVGPVSKPSNTNMAAIVVPVFLVVILAGVGAFFFIRRRSRVSRNNKATRKESMDVTTPLNPDLEQCSPVVDTGPVYARVDLSKKKNRGAARGDYTAVQCHERPLSDEPSFLSSADVESRTNRRDRSSTSEESLAPRDNLDSYFVENDLKIEDERSLESIPFQDDDFDYMDSGDYSPGGAYAAKEDLNDRDSGALTDHTGDSPSRLPLLVPPVPMQLPHSEDEFTSDSDFEEVPSPDVSGSYQTQRSVLEDYTIPTPPRPAIRPHFYDQVYIPRSAINNFVDSTNYVKGRKRSDLVHTNPYEEIGPAGGATGRGPVPSTSGVGRGMAIYATVDETRMDGRAYGLSRFNRGLSSPPDMTPEELSNYGNQGATASPTLGPLLPTKRSNTSFRGPPLLLSRRRSRRRRTRSLPPRSRQDNLPSLPDRPPTHRGPAQGGQNDPSVIKGVVPDYVTSRSLDLLDSGCCDVDLDVLVPPADDLLNPSILLLPPALPERTQLSLKPLKPIPIKDRPLPEPEPKKERPIPDRTSTTARTIDLEQMVSYDVDLDSVVPISREDLEDTFAPLVWLTNPEPRYSGLLHSGADRDDSIHQYTSLDGMPAASQRGHPKRPRRNSLSSSKSDGHLDKPTMSCGVQYLDINFAAVSSSAVLPSPGGSSDHSSRSGDYDSVYSPNKDPIYESVGNPSNENQSEA